MCRVSRRHTVPHTRRSVTGNRSMFVGLDVHRETIDVSIAEGERQGEVRHYGVIASDLEPLDKVVRALRAPDRRLHFAYEAGPCGCGIYRQNDRPRRRLRRRQFVDESEAQWGSGEHRSPRQPDARAGKVPTEGVSPVALRILRQRDRMPGREGDDYANGNRHLSDRVRRGRRCGRSAGGLQAVTP